MVYLRKYDKYCFLKTKIFYPRWDEIGTLIVAKPFANSKVDLRTTHGELVSVVKKRKEQGQVVTGQMIVVCPFYLDFTAFYEEK